LQGGCLSQVAEEYGNALRMQDNKIPIHFFPVFHGYKFSFVCGFGCTQMAFIVNFFPLLLGYIHL
jgi:hypothetical protein